LAAKYEAVRRQRQNPASAFTSLNHQQLSANIFFIIYIPCHKAFSLNPTLLLHQSFKAEKKENKS
jgi:hypothetical protein